ncbi:HNH endonuclease, partial [bacterium]|nr:HNH endonuclease [bacterium]
MLDSQVLVLNQNYEPMQITNARRAIVLVFSEKAEIIEHNHAMVRTVSTAMPLPSIVRLSRFVLRPNRKVLLSRKNVIRRDKQQCQYCGTHVGAMTVDHI